MNSKLWSISSLVLRQFVNDLIIIMDSRLCYNIHKLQLTRDMYADDTCT